MLIIKINFRNANYPKKTHKDVVGQSHFLQMITLMSLKHSDSETDQAATTGLSVDVQHALQCLIAGTYLPSIRLWKINMFTLCGQRIGYIQHY